MRTTAVPGGPVKVIDDYFVGWTAQRALRTQEIVA
jgi:hypothetical protein